MHISIMTMDWYITYQFFIVESRRSTLIKTYLNAKNV